MDWKYKNFHQERLFPESPDVVAGAARAIMGESLGWQVTDTAEGFTAKGSSFAHGAIANFQFQSAAGGTLLTVELLVERAGAAGFMLFDVGGYYNIQVRKWLDGIQSRLHAQSIGQEPPPHQPLPPQNKSAACLFHGCLGFIFVVFGLWVLVTLICAVVGLITGHLYLLGRSGTLVLNGIPGRVVSALILVFAAWILWRVKKGRRRKA